MKPTQDFILSLFQGKRKTIINGKMQFLEPASCSGEKALTPPRGFRCSAWSEKLL